MFQSELYEIPLNLRMLADYLLAFSLVFLGIFSRFVRAGTAVIDLATAEVLERLLNRVVRLKQSTDGVV
ncbi:hypothetical protein [Haloplanus salilacus]|uniref:hypothetical protein n=1 Tax=Haloplanus salilacus TaxID=2949994 RepID=UPI0030D0A652